MKTKFSRAFTMSIALAIALGGLAQAQEAEPAEAYADIPGTRVSIVVPEGFSLAPGFPGLTRADLGASLVVTEVPGPYGEVLQSFTQGIVAERGVQVRQTDTVQVGGLEGTLLQIRRNQDGTVATGWLLLFGNDKATVMLAATAPEAEEEKIAASVRKSMLGAKWSPDKVIDPFLGLGFKITMDEAFEIRGRRPGGILLTRKEAGEDFTPDEPVFVVFPAENPEVAPLESFAKRLLTDNPQFVEMTSIVERSTKIKDFAAHEVTAEAKYASQDIPVRLYSLVIRTSQRDFVIQGFVSPARWEQYLPVFRAMAASFEETPAPAHLH